MRTLVHRIVYIILLFSPVVAGSCVITFTGRQDEHLPPIDYSFPVTGKSTEIGPIHSVIAYSWNGERQKVPAAGIVLTGQIRQMPFSFDKFQRILARSPLIELKNQGDLGRRFWLPPVYYQYGWEGSILLDGSTAVNTDIIIDVYGEKNGSGKQCTLYKTSTPSMRLICDDPVELYTGYSDFPFLVGYAVTGTSRFRIYAVIDNEPGPNKIYRNGVFFHPLQKFQIINEHDTVFAEIQGNSYTLYDTIPEPEMKDIKYAIALLVGFRHTAQVIINLRETWDIPWFYRYEYNT